MRSTHISRRPKGVLPFFVQSNVLGKVRSCSTSLVWKAHWLSQGAAVYSTVALYLRTGRSVGWNLSWSILWTGTSRSAPAVEHCNSLGILDSFDEVPMGGGGVDFGLGVLVSALFISCWASFWRFVMSLFENPAKPRVLNSPLLEKHGEPAFPQSGDLG